VLKLRGDHRRDETGTLIKCRMYDLYYHGGVATSLMRMAALSIQHLMTRRVVVTGIGAVSPNGIGREAFWSATRRGQTGIGPIRRFDTGDLAVRIAGEVTGLDENAYIAAKDRPHVSRVVPLSIAAVSEALVDAGIEPERMTREELREIGVILGTGGGSQAFTEEQYRLYHSGNWRQCSVYVVPSSTVGTLASEMAVLVHAAGQFANAGFEVLEKLLASGIDKPVEAFLGDAGGSVGGQGAQFTGGVLLLGASVASFVGEGSEALRQFLEALAGGIKQLIVAAGKLAEAPLEVIVKLFPRGMNL